MSSARTRARPPGSRSRASAGSRAARSRKARRRRGRGQRPSRLRRVLRGDRPYWLALVGLLVVITMMAVGPLQNYTAAADRVDALERTRDQLREEVDGLEDRRFRLEDPDELELLARSDHGLVKPGEIPFVVVAPEEDLEQVRPQPPEADDAPADGPWYRRLGRALAELFDASS